MENYTIQLPIIQKAVVVMEVLASSLEEAKKTAVMKFGNNDYIIEDMLFGSATLDENN